MSGNPNRSVETEHPQRITERIDVAGVQKVKSILGQDSKNTRAVRVFSSATKRHLLRRTDISIMMNGHIYHDQKWTYLL